LKLSLFLAPDFYLFKTLGRVAMLILLIFYEDNLSLPPTNSILLGGALT